jgi:hypothetical protein
MGRYLKNVKLQTGSNQAIQVPLSTSSGGPAVPENGMIRFNTTLNQLEWFFAGQWWDVANRGPVLINYETYTSADFDVTNSVATTHQAINANEISVMIGGLWQIPGINYTVVTTPLTKVTLTSAPPAVDSWGNQNYVTVIFGLGSSNADYPA